MAYLGGKAKGATHILRILNDPVFDDFDYVEPFVGMAHIFRRVLRKKSYTALDGSRLLMVLLCNVKCNGRHPTVSKDEYDKLKHDYYSDHLSQDDQLKAAYAAYTYSFMGIQWGGYCPTSGKRNYVEERLRYYARLAQNPAMNCATLLHSDYRDLEKLVACSQRTLVYCDPPYAGGVRHASTPSGAFTYSGSFDSNRFWEFIRSLSRKGVAVLVSEYTAPDDFLIVAAEGKPQTVGRGQRRIVCEHLYVHEDCWVARHFSPRPTQNAGASHLRVTSSAF